MNRPTKTCEQDGCERQAVASFVWPGRAERQVACWRHFCKADATARALGVEIGDPHHFGDPYELSRQVQDLAREEER